MSNVGSESQGQDALQAGSGTTQLRFQLNIAHPSPADSQVCNMVNDSYTLTF